MSDNSAINTRSHCSPSCSTQSPCAALNETVKHETKNPFRIFFKKTTHSFLSVGIICRRVKKIYISSWLSKCRPAQPVWRTDLPSYFPCRVRSTASHKHRSVSIVSSYSTTIAQLLPRAAIFVSVLTFTDVLCVGQCGSRWSYLGGAPVWGNSPEAMKNDHRRHLPTWPGHQLPLASGCVGSSEQE